MGSIKMTTETQLPQGWEIKKFGDVIDIQGGSQPPKSEFIYEPKENYIQLLQIRDFGENGVPTFVPKNRVTKFCDKDDILIARYGASLGRIVTGLSGAYNVALAKTIFDDGVLFKRFVYYLLQTQIFQVPLTMISRSAQNGFAKHEIAHIEIPIPPLETQQAIVNKIESLFAEIDAGIASLKTAQQQLKHYRQSLLKNAFNGELTKQWRLENADRLPSANELLAQIQTAREQHHAQQLADWQIAVKQWEQAGKQGKKPSKPKAPTQAVKFEENFADLPNRWGVMKLDNLATEYVLGKMLDKNKNKGKDRPYLGNINVRWGKFEFSETKTMKIEDDETERYLVKYGDLIICEGGEPGRCAVWKHDKEMFIQKALHRVRFPFVYLAEFAFYYLSYAVKLPLVTDLFTGTTIKHLTGTALGNILFPVCSLTEQTQIIAILESKLTACDQLTTELATQLKQAELLKQAVLKSAFSGSLLDK